MESLLWDAGSDALLGTTQYQYDGNYHYQYDGNYNWQRELCTTTRLVTPGCGLGASSSPNAASKKGTGQFLRRLECSAVLHVVLEDAIIRSEDMASVGLLVDCELTVMSRLQLQVSEEKQEKT